MASSGDLMVYWQLVRAGFIRQARHRTAMVAGLFTNVVFGLVRSAVLVAATSTGTFAGYDRPSAGAYVWLSQAMLGALQIMDPDPEVAQRIKTGDIAVDFLRPLDVQAGYLAADLGRAAYTTLPRGLPCVAVGALTFGLRMPSRVDSYLLGAASVVLAVATAFLAQFAVAAAGSG